MNEQQALAEARRRWGKEGTVRSHRDGSCSVGPSAKAGRYRMFMRKGHGPNWAAAFHEVDRIARRDREDVALAADAECPRCDKPMKKHQPESVHHPTWLLEEHGVDEDQLVCGACHDEYIYGVRLGYYGRIYIGYLQAHRDHGPRGSRLEYAGSCWAKLSQRGRRNVARVCKKIGLPLHDDPQWEQESMYAKAKD
jgi:hypothetical protein